MALTKINSNSYSTLDATKLTGNLPAISGASLTGLTSGLPVIDSWKVTTQWTSSGNYHVNSNWTRVSDAQGFGNAVGTGMTESSGYFSFPSTGYYLITFQAFAYYNTASNYVGVHIYATEDNSSYGISNQAYTNTSGQTTQEHVGAFTNMIFRVADTSTHKVLFKCEAQNNTDWKAASAEFRIGAQFMKLGDTS